jgi:hypothetical protein
VARRRFRLALLAAGLVAVGSGCATAPVGGSVQSLPGGNNEPQAFVQPLPPPGPGPNWTAEQVVRGFIHASASFALDPGAALKYLAPGTKWKHSKAVQIVSGNLVLSQTSGRSYADTPQQTVTVAGQRIATLSSSGQYSYQPAGETSFTFQLEQYGPRLLIAGLPLKLPLLLTQQDFEQVFQPQNLYFLSGAPTTPNALVPDPIYAPVQGATSALSTNLATGLVDGLIDNGGCWAAAKPGCPWLSGATITAFPRGTRLIGGVTIVNQQAVVNLGGAAATASPVFMSEMYTQLSQTLTSSVYGSPPVATSVQLEINGKAPSSLPDSVASVPPVGIGLSGAGSPPGSSKQALYYASDGAVRQVTSSKYGSLGTAPASAAAQVGSPAGLTALAASRVDQQVAAAIPAGRGCAVNVAAAGGKPTYTTYTLSRSGGACTSLSWDDGVNLWAVNGAGVWVLQPDTPPVKVSLPANLNGGRVVELRMAPDAVRAAILVQSGQHQTQLYLAAVRYRAQGISLGMAVPVGGSSLPRPGPTAVSWANAYSLVAIDGSAVYQVPLTGGLSQFLAPLPTGVQIASLTAASNQLAIGTTTGQILLSQGPSYLSWATVPAANATPSTVAFPG